MSAQATINLTAIPPTFTGLFQAIVDRTQALFDELTTLSQTCQRLSTTRAPQLDDVHADFQHSTSKLKRRIAKQEEAIADLRRELDRKFTSDMPGCACRRERQKKRSRKCCLTRPQPKRVVGLCARMHT